MSSLQPCGRWLRECADDACRNTGECAWPPAPGVSITCGRARHGSCFGCACSCHEAPVPGGPPMREGNNPRTGIAYNE